MGDGEEDRQRPKRRVGGTTTMTRPRIVSLVGEGDASRRR